MECDNCKAMNHLMAVVPYVNVELCPLHAAAEQLRDALEECVALITSDDELANAISEPKVLAIAHAALTATKEHPTK